MFNPLSLSLPLLSVKEAARQDFASISTPINRNTEQPILKSMEKSMRGVDAVWIVQSGTTVELGRKRSDLKVGNYETYSKPSPIFNSLLW